MIEKNEEPLLRRGRRSALLLAGIISAMTLAVYLPALRNDFVNWDDPLYVYENIHIRSLSWSLISWAFSDISTAGSWHPLTWMSHAIDYSLWGLNPFGHHLTNILLHAANSFIVVFLVLKLLEAAPAPLHSPSPIAGKENSAFSGGEKVGWLSSFPEDRFVLITAGVTGVLFGLHPLHVESVAWIADRKDLLCTLFFLLSLTAYTGYIHALERQTILKERWMFFSNRWYVLSLFFFSLALASKTMAVTLPVILLLLDWYPFKRDFSLPNAIRVFSEKLPFAILSLLISLTSLIGQKTFGALGRLESVGLLDRMLVACKAFMMYLWKIAVPVRLVPYYPYPERITFLTFEYLAPVIAAGLVTTVCIIQVRKQRLWLALWGGYFITVLPIIGIIQVGTHYMADRYAYLPSLVPFIFAGLVAARTWTRAGSMKLEGTIVKGLTAAAALFLLVSLVTLTMKQAALWKNSIIFWSYVIENEGDHVPVAYHNRGLAYLKLHQLDQALEDLSKAISLKPDYPDYLTNRGLVLKEKGEDERAMADFNEAIRIEPRYPYAYLLRGSMYQEKGQSEPAIEDFTALLALEPDNVQAYMKRGFAFAQTGRTEQALEDYTLAINADPAIADAYNNRGLLFEQTGRLDRSMEDLNTAITIDPSNIEAYNNRGLLFEYLGQFDRAIGDYGKAIELRPEDYLSYSNRATAFAKMGQLHKAIADYTKVISLNPDYEGTYFYRAGLHMNTGRVDLAALDYQQACARGNKEACKAWRALKSR